MVEPPLGICVYQKLKNDVEVLVEALGLLAVQVLYVGRTGRVL